MYPARAFRTPFVTERLPTQTTMREVKAIRRALKRELGARAEAWLDVVPCEYARACHVAGEKWSEGACGWHLGAAAAAPIDPVLRQELAVAACPFCPAATNAEWKAPDDAKLVRLLAFILRAIVRSHGHTVVRGFLTRGGEGPDDAFGDLGLAGTRCDCKREEPIRDKRVMDAFLQPSTLLGEASVAVMGGDTYLGMRGAERSGQGI
jgi:hypothetical protein